MSRFIYALVVLSVVALGAPSATAQSPERFSLEVAGGLLSSDTYIDYDDQRSDGEYRSSFIEVGGEVHPVRLPALTGSLGAFLRLADVGYWEGFQSGFGPQNLGLYATVQNEALAARVGYLFDVGNRLDPTGVAGLPSRSDQQDAFLMGLSGQHALGATRLFGGLDAFLTAPDPGALMLTDEMGTELGRADYDQGDTYAFHAGAGYAFRRAEMGLRVQYSYTSEASIDFGDVDPATFELENGRLDGTDRYQLSLIPYVTVRPGPSGLSLSLQGSAMGGGFVSQEYVPVGLLVSGQATEAPRFPITLRVRYGF